MTEKFHASTEPACARGACDKYQVVLDRVLFSQRQHLTVVRPRNCLCLKEKIHQVDAFDLKNYQTNQSKSFQALYQT